MENEKRFNKILKEMRDLYAKKNSDYGDSFKDTHERFGSVAGVIRINDKVNRLNNLVERESRVEDESFRDTLIDLANYAVLLIMEIDGNQDEQLELFDTSGDYLKDIMKTFSEIDTAALTNDNKAKLCQKEEEIKCLIREEAIAKAKAKANAEATRRINEYEYLEGGA